ncbi:MAG: hypothetical protein KatS3mg061_0553 [Dehalococcoidia bacterium]|nr:MAG: hypothetical protein KatS3mg061_0553 [Dehalococcoidia bacterium]
MAKQLGLAFGALGGLSALFLAFVLALPLATAEDRCARPPADAARFSAWLKAGCYLGWEHDPAIRSTGPVINGVDNSVHDRVRVYYSPEVVAWLRAGRPGKAPAGAILVKEQYPLDGDTLQGWTAILRDERGSWDGWFWYQEFFGYGIQAQFGFSGCLRCHASAESNTTYASLANLEGRSYTYPVPGEVQWYPGHVAKVVDTPAARALLRQPLPAEDPAFRALFTAAPYPSAATVLPIPNHSYDHVVAGPNGPQHFLTSDQCIGCHNAYDLPNMQFTESSGRVLNLSPYGEWSSSLMGLAGRDPVFHAQLEAETSTYRPGVRAFTENFCYSCHGAMGQRQITLDGQGPFRHELVYALGNDPGAMYGALARDGVSCLVCHHIAPEGLGTPATFAGKFALGPANEIYGPYSDPKTYPMEQALGITPRGGAQISSSALCGSCHTVIIPQVPTSYQGDPTRDPTIRYEYEQTTYLEWRNSAYQNEVEPYNPRTVRTCQDCHMPTAHEGTLLRFKIANVEEPDYPPTDHRAPVEKIQLSPRQPFARHTLVAVNLFVMEMFHQFGGLLGILAPDDSGSQRQTATSLLTALESSVQLGRTATATLEVLSAQRRGDVFEATVRVTNLAGHKFPSGVGFRRAWLDFRVLDAGGRLLWASGRPNALGVIVGPDGEPLATEFSTTTWQPHWQVITSQDQVQIYEERTLDDQFQLTTSFLGRFYGVKDNRLLPRGWRNDAPFTEFMQPDQVFGDPQYYDGSGSDEVTYRVPWAAIPGAARVEVRLHYQSIPPYYLRDRFRTQGPETARLAYITSRLNLKGSPIEGWVFTLAEATVRLP